jgi:hypothetical protein
MMTSRMITCLFSLNCYYYYYYYYDYYYYY